ncbi:MAG: ribosome biogenesis GTP-binding protein YihA/YsxC [Deltaproteobacteria bacterium]|nr:ribosome biogenesis GTP-binding protein YihA/YsxC [Deltaproteobacteria bacterium]
MKINSAVFLLGAAQPSQFPPSVVPEVAFAGKSNVGKSSLINALLNRKGLVKTSSTPGKTSEINFFLINDTFRLVDLPGYGYSKASKVVRQGWESLIETYLKNRPNLKGVVMIVDCRHPPSPLDLQMKAWLDHYNVPLVMVASKADKLPRTRLAAQNLMLEQAFTSPRPLISHSVKQPLGRQELWAVLNDWLTP